MMKRTKSKRNKEDGREKERERIGDERDWRSYREERERE